MSAGQFFSKPTYPDREGDSRGRPRAVNPRTGQEQSWTSASTFASALDNPFGLMTRDGRNIVMGISTRPDLAAMALAGALRDDVAKVDEVIREAKAVMASSSGANLGTAAHAAITRAWQYPNEPVPEAYLPLVKAFAAALKEHGLTIKAAAQKVINTTYDSLGELDFVLTEADGTEVIGDAKSGKLEHAKRKFAVQLAMYDGAEFLVYPDTGQVTPIPWKLAHSHGVLLHLDLENNAVSVYRIDLRIGRWGAGLAEQVRAWHKLDPLSPYVSPVTVGPGAAIAEAMQANARETRPDVPGTMSLGNLAADEPGAEYDQYLTNSEPELDHVAIAAEQSTTDRFEEWMKLDKAPLQMHLKKVHGWTDDAHNRRWLARAIIALEDGLTGAAVKKFAAAKDDETTPDGKLTGAAAAAVERAEATGPSATVIHQAIAGANSMAALRALQADVVERRGDQAWDEGMVEAARQRAVELSAQQHAEASESILREIASAPSKVALKDIWERVTVGNSVPEQWTEEMTKAGLDRLDEIAKATPPPPANPFE